MKEMPGMMQTLPNASDDTGKSFTGAAEFTVPEDTRFNDTKCLQPLCKPHVIHIKKNEFELFGQV